MVSEINNYGFIGWKEFLSNRTELLNNFDISRNKNISRPVQTEHGNAAEAAIRNWFDTFLPKRFSVTSGYIIPDIISDNYKLEHYDAIIYDQIESPILWIDQDQDRSSAGSRRAIPAQYIHAVFEIKSTLNIQNINKAISKLQSLNTLSNHLHNNFFCGIIFFEFSEALKNNKKILPSLLPTKPIFNYIGGMVLRCKINEKMTGTININSINNPNEYFSITTPLVKNIDDLDIYRNANQQVQIGEQGCGVQAYSDGKKWHYTKKYTSSIMRNNEIISLTWSYNEFSDFLIKLLLLLNGRYNPNNSNIHFGHIFDNIK